MALHELRVDLLAEQASLDDVVTSIDDDQWHLATPSPGWSVADQIGHLTFFDRSAATSIRDPDSFRDDVKELFEGALLEGVDDYTLSSSRALGPSDLLTTWREARGALESAAASLDVETRVSWFGPSMSASSFLGARLMETWAHGTDVVDALGVRRVPTSRLRHVAKLGFITRTWSYQVRGEVPPPGDIRLELIGPSDEVWTWGPDDADDVIAGSAEEFCLVVTQRRHVADTSLACGDLGRHWLDRAQVFAGAASEGPRPRSTP